MTNNAINIRSNSSQKGVCAGVSSWGRNANKKRNGGNDLTNGAGGVTRSSHHRAGKIASEYNIHGDRNVRSLSLSTLAPQGVSYKLIKRE